MLVVIREQRRRNGSTQVGAADRRLLRHVGHGAHIADTTAAARRAIVNGALLRNEIEVGPIRNAIVRQSIQLLPVVLDLCRGLVLVVQDHAALVAGAPFQVEILWLGAQREWSVPGGGDGKC